MIQDDLSNSANFIISNLIDFYVKNNDSVVFVGLQQNYAHYYSISKRIGSSLEPYIKSDTLIYLDFFSTINDWIPEDLPLTEEATLFWGTLPPKAIRMKINDGCAEDVMKTLYDEIIKQISTLKGF